MKKLGSLFGLNASTTSGFGRSADAKSGEDNGDKVTFFPQFGDPKTKPQFVEYEFDASNDEFVGYGGGE